MSAHNGLDRNRVLAEAARWVARLAADDASASDRAEFQEWLARSPGHLSVYRETQRTWSDLDALSGLAASDPGALPDALRSEIARCGAKANASLAGAARRDGARRLAMAATACLVGALGLVWLVNLRHRDAGTTSAIAAHLRTQVGQRSQTMLADGSIVCLNTDTDLQVAFSPTQRSVHLVSGEAYFEVAKDPRRPFVVSVADRTITAVGTAFDVYSRGDQTRVTVVEGTVEVARRTPPVVKNASALKRAAPAPRKAAPASVLVEPPQKVTVAQTATLLDAATTVATLPPQAVVHEASWRQGRLYFDAVTLKDMVAQLNPYLTAHVVIADPSIEGFVGGGVVQVDNAESILAAIALAWPVEVKREAPDLIVLTRRR